MTGQFMWTKILLHPDAQLWGFQIDRADPEILIDDLVLWDLFWKRDTIHPALTLTRPLESPESIGHSGSEDAAPVGRVCFCNSLLRIEATNQTVIYRIERYLPNQKAWIGRWPD